MSTTDPRSLARLLRRRAAGAPLEIDVSGSSMGPRMVTGSKAVVVAAARPRWGEIWAFFDTDAVIFVHRCVGRRRGQLRFWGDANPLIDGPVDPERLVGRVVAVRAPDGTPRALGFTERWWYGTLAGARHACRRVEQAARRRTSRAGRRA
jgi:hypothetical protein